jgi:hypothetical protein
MTATDFRIAAICTVYYPGSHADVVVSRWLETFPNDPAWGWERGRTQVVSLYVAQFPPEEPPESFRPGFATDDSERYRFNRDIDLARLQSQRHNLPLFPTIRDALTLGGDTLAVDGVLLIGEHGEYPFNELGQHLYPRKEFFDEIVAVFRESGRSAPIFCDKHLSWNQTWAQEMVDTSREMGFPLMAGSSVPYSLKLKPALPDNPRLAEGVAIFYSGAEVYGFHSLEGMASVVEQRAGGEAGIRAITVYEGEQVWRAMEAGEWSVELFDAALSTAHRTNEDDPRKSWQPRGPEELHGKPLAFCLDHVDGLRTTHVQLNDHVEDMCFAVRDENGQIHANRWEAGDRTIFYAHFATLDSQIERMFLTGRSPVPIERTLLTTLTVATWMEALQRPGERMETPHLQIAYETLPGRV